MKDDFLPDSREIASVHAAHVACADHCYVHGVIVTYAVRNRQMILLRENHT